MHDHDLDLIASLADGSLDDQTEARARLETCQECRIEYEAQLLVLAALARMEPATLTELETGALHRDLWTELRMEPVERTSSTPWWYRFSYAAAGLFVVVGLVAVVNQLRMSDDTAGQVETFSEVSSGLEDGSSQDAGADQTPTGTEAGDASETTIAAAEDATGTTIGSTTVETAEFEALAADTRSQQLPPTVRTAATEDQAACLSDAGLEDHELVGTFSQDPAYLIAIPAGLDLDAETPVSFVNAETCQVVHVED